METNKHNSHIPVSVKNITEKRKSLTPAILGMPNSHGVKFSVNMTSEDKKELLTKLEEWRKARKQKLAASILAKQKQVDKPKASLPSFPVKNKPVPVREDKHPKSQIRQSVFERLYQNNGKIKKQEVTSNNNKPQQIQKTNIRKSSILPLDESKQPERVLTAVKDEYLPEIPESDSVTMLEKETVTLVENSGKDDGLLSVNDTENTKRETDENCSVEITKENSSEMMEVTKPLDVVSDQLEVMDDKSSENNPELEILPTKTVESGKGKKLRRSISMIFRQKCRTENAVHRSISVKNLNEIDIKMPKIDHGNLQRLQRQDQDAKQGTKTETVAKLPVFATPKNTKLLTSSCLRNKLENWLKVNGHPLEGYRHLRCFGIPENAKPPPEVSAVALDETFENSYYATAPNTPAVEEDKENVTPPTVVQQVDVKEVENWLRELHRLIVEVKYPSERCEEWFTAIRKKCTSCSQLPIYWECLAALHESKGDVKSAIEDYERVIIKGGEVDTVGESLAQLFDKMVIENKKRSKHKMDKGLDPKNIFKSTVIKFALQQKAIKKLSSEIDPGVRQQLYVATPVRRSTRIQTPLKSTDEVSSLQTLTPELRKNVTFKPNESLLNGD